MRRTVGLVLWVWLSGCSLDFGGDFGDDGGGDDGGGDDGVDPTPDCGAAAATCEDGIVRLSEFPGTTCDEFDPPIVVETCPGDCTSDYMGLCFSQGCATADELCVDPPAAPLPAVLDCGTGPTCTADGTATCGAVDQCGGPVVTGECTCMDDVRTCEPACADGLCSTAEVQAALVGTWSGTAVTPWDTYSLQLTITADGHYLTERPGSEPAFYYGVDGGGDARRFHVIGQTALGATAVVRIFFGFGSVQDGLARGIRLDGDHLTFDFYSAWLGCMRYAQFDLTRAP